MPKKPDFLDELACVALACLTEDAGLDEEAARAAADRLVDRVRRELGGINWYVPKGKYADVEAVRREIGRRWNGQNTAELSREFGISETWLRELHAQANGRVFMRQREIRKVQHPPPGGGGKTRGRPLSAPFWCP